MAGLSWGLGDTFLRRKVGLLAVGEGLVLRVPRARLLVWRWDDDLVDVEGADERSRGTPSAHRWGAALLGLLMTAVRRRALKRA